jgi:hypothetical protein
MPGAGCVDQRHVAAKVSRHQARHPEHRLTIEHQGIEECVVEAPVDDIDANPAVDGAHEHDIVMDFEVRALDQLDPHLIGEKAVLIKSRIVMAGREQHGYRLGRPIWRDRVQRFAQQVG